MSKFNRGRPRIVAQAPLVTDVLATSRTHEGAPGFARDAKSELFLLAVSNMVKEDTFYEKAKARDDRYTQLVRAVAVSDPEWTARFLVWLRNEANMRSASLVGALEAARAMVQAKVPGSRAIVRDVLQRADEPGEALAYWTSTYGRAIPKPVKRGIADSVVRLYNERSLLKYDTDSKGFRFGDVIELTHPAADKIWQGELFEVALARRRGREVDFTGQLDLLQANAAFRRDVALEPELALSASALHEAGMTWEDALSLVGSKGSKAKLWEALIPSMGYMALLRNLRNFDQAGISGEAVQQVIAKLTDPWQVRKSRQFPFRFFSAYKALDSVRWSQALEVAFDLTVENIPELPGRSLVLVDRSGSMFMPVSGKSNMIRAEVGALFGAALALRNPGRVTLVQYGSTAHEVPYRAGGSVLRLMGQFTNLGGTYTAAATRQFYNGHDRVLVVTDEQHHDGGAGSVVPSRIPVYTWNLAGYRYGGDAGTDNRWTFGGLTDKGFQMVPLLEHGQNGTWPF